LLTVARAAGSSRALRFTRMGNYPAPNQAIGWVRRWQVGRADEVAPARCDAPAFLMCNHASLLRCSCTKPDPRRLEMSDTTNGREHQLLGLYDSPFVRRVAVTMQFYGIPYAHVSLSVFRHMDAMRPLNPLFKVPMLTLPNGESCTRAPISSTTSMNWRSSAAFRR
jgi:hypothetical protein